MAVALTQAQLVTAVAERAEPSMSDAKQGSTVPLKFLL